MKKASVSITLTLLATAASLLTGCSRRYEVKRCVDADGFAVAEDKCAMEDQHQSPLRPRMYFWNYGGNGGYNYGDRIVGGRSYASTGMESISAHDAASFSGARGGSGTVTRGGFGHSFGGHGGGE